MERGLKLVIEFLETLPSTQSELISRIKSGKVFGKYALVAEEQSAGFGSRENEWVSSKGNLFLSFCLKDCEIASDIQKQSLSIYFGLILQEFLNKNGSKAWLKWPNDIYIGENKCGGILTSIVRNFIVCGIGLNLINAPENAEILDIKMKRDTIIYGFLEMVEKQISWKQIFSKLLIEFEKSKKFVATINGKKVPLSEAILCDDGSILINDKKVYSLR